MASGQDQAAKPLKVFLFAGTSNLVSGSVDQLPKDLKMPQKEILVFHDGGWVSLEPGTSPARRNPNSFGPEVTFGPAMARHFGEPVGIIMTTLAAVSDRAGYAETVKKATAARQSRPIVIMGFLLQAGERDARTQELAEAFQKNMTGLIDSARRDFGNPDLAVAINRAIPNPDMAKFLEKVREAESGLRVPGFRVVDCDDVERGGDKIHYTTKGQLEFGRRFAAAMIDLLTASKASGNKPGSGQK
ncbi:MAG: sialate O-acetylesterase [Acidobacteria bacterium]|nr:sialate O-acetylesterase [Acidobacteriota bacterium]